MVLNCTITLLTYLYLHLDFYAALPLPSFSQVFQKPIRDIFPWENRSSVLQNHSFLLYKNLLWTPIEKVGCSLSILLYYLGSGFFRLTLLLIWLCLPLWALLWEVYYCTRTFATTTPTQFVRLISWGVRGHLQTSSRKANMCTNLQALCYSTTDAAIMSWIVINMISLTLQVTRFLLFF